MQGRRIALLVTCLGVAVLAAVFMVMAWDRAGRIATAVSALAALASVGVAVWAAIPPGVNGSLVRLSNTGKASSTGGGDAVSGASGPATGLPNRIEVDHTGDADASNGGDAVSGISWN